MPYAKERWMAEPLPPQKQPNVSSRSSAFHNRPGRTVAETAQIPDGHALPSRPARVFTCPVPLQVCSRQPSGATGGPAAGRYIVHRDLAQDRQK